MNQKKPTIAIAGATGFVGTSLLKVLAKEYHIVGLTRSPTRADYDDHEQNISWKHCDLFSIESIESGLEGVDYAIYLVHSMLPSARLTQADFQDLDLILADNFAKACEHQKIKQILYIGGIIPKEKTLSRHLQSRLEVEQMLSQGKTPLTSIRCGLIVGPGGSSLRILVKLVQRLPLMLLPKWTQSLTQPIAIQDVIRGVVFCLGNEQTFEHAYEIGGPEVMTYHQMMQTAAKVLGIKRKMIPVPFFTLSLSKLWVSLTSSSSQALVNPLVDSLKHDLVIAPNLLQEYLLPNLFNFETALQNSLDSTGNLLPNPRVFLKKTDVQKIKEARLVRSIQRFNLPEGKNAEWVAKEYQLWLPRFFSFLIVCRNPSATIHQFYLQPLNLMLLELELQTEISQKNHQIFYITGGFLARTDGVGQGRFEFFEVLDQQHIIAAIHDFSPRLPWYIYNNTQALIHIWVMKSFGKFLKDTPHLSIDSEK